MSEKFTPEALGPFDVERGCADAFSPISGHYQVYNDYLTVYVSDYDWADVYGLRQEAFARFIAAAPDMYAALSAVNKLIAEAAYTGFNHKDGDWPQRLFESQQQTSMALKKARGEE